MRKVTLQRTESTDEGTFGCVTIEGSKLVVFSGELPWRNDQKDYSCLPPGEYFCAWRPSPAHGFCYHVGILKDGKWAELPDGRTDIEVHSANFCGDKTLGRICQLRGCIALGTTLGSMVGQRCVMNSKEGLANFVAEMNREDFILTISGPEVQKRPPMVA